jgi:hypothetical protein
MPKKAKLQPAKEIYQVKVTLNNTNPPVWRSVLVPDNLSLAQFHILLQIVMGWDNCHLHQFEIGDKRYINPQQAEELFDEDNGDGDERKTYLGKLGLKEKDAFIYLYDMGDGWEHKILIEKILPVETGKTYPVCLEGKLACPPEDCGGTPGYYGIIGMMKEKDLSNPEYEEMIEWLGEPFDHEKFDLNSVNESLKEFARNPAKYDMEMEW